MAAVEEWLPPCAGMKRVFRVLVVVQGVLSAVVVYRRRAYTALKTSDYYDLSEQARARNAVNVATTAQPSKRQQQRYPKTYYTRACDLTAVRRGGDWVQRRPTKSKAEGG